MNFTIVYVEVYKAFPVKAFLKIHICTPTFFTIIKI